DMGLSPHPPRDHIRVLVDFNYGAWCRWVLYQERPDADFRVTTDGRTQWAPFQRDFASFAIENASGEWLPELKHWDRESAAWCSKSINSTCFFPSLARLTRNPEANSRPPHPERPPPTYAGGRTRTQRLPPDTRGLSACDTHHPGVRVSGTAGGRNARSTS